MKMMKTRKPKFTFKTIKPTGPYKSFESPEHIIKLDKRKVGNIYPPYNRIGRKHDDYEIVLMVLKENPAQSENPNCIWRHYQFKKTHKTLEEAKEWLNANIEEILKLNLYQMEV